MFTSNLQTEKILILQRNSSNLCIEKYFSYSNIPYNFQLYGID